MQGDTGRVREFLHGEHAGCYDYDHGNHYITDGHHKYIWYSQTGEEHLFNLDEDPHEMCDITRNPNSETEIQPWRNRLIEFLKDRPEGFTDGTRLIPGQPHEELLPGYGSRSDLPVFMRNISFTIPHHLWIKMYTFVIPRINASTCNACSSCSARRYKCRFSRQFSKRWMRDAIFPKEYAPAFLIQDVNENTVFDLFNNRSCTSIKINRRV